MQIKFKIENRKAVPLCEVIVEHSSLSLNGTLYFCLTMLYYNRDNIAFNATTGYKYTEGKKQIPVKVMNNQAFSLATPHSD